MQLHWKEEARTTPSTENGMQARTLHAPDAEHAPSWARPWAPGVQSRRAWCLRGRGCGGEGSQTTAAFSWFRKPSPNANRIDDHVPCHLVRSILLRVVGNPFHYPIYGEENGSTERSATKRWGNQSLGFLLCRRAGIPRSLGL